jgi:hypothetical protein
MNEPQGHPTSLGIEGRPLGGAESCLRSVDAWAMMPVSNTTPPPLVDC